MTAGAPLFAAGYSLSSFFIIPFSYSDFKYFSPFLSISYTKASCADVTNDGSDDGDGGSGHDDGDDAPSPSRHSGDDDGDGNGLRTDYR